MSDEKRPLRIANASGFYGDRFSAWQEMLTGGPVDVVTGDYLAELTMLILARDRLVDPTTGYAKTFLRQMEQCLALAIEHGVAIVTNAGGLNPAGLAEALRHLAQRLGLDVAIGQVVGDAVAWPQAVAANAYLGAFGIAECLKAGAQIVVTGRVTDASLVVGPAIARFGWRHDDLDPLAGATVAGHILECGAQATGGNFAFFTELPDHAGRPGFPLAELHPDGSSVITKHPGTGGAVTLETVTAQLLYELGAPDYAGPDVVAHFDTITLRQVATNRVEVSGVRGSSPPATAKVAVTGLAGYRNAMSFVLCGLNIAEKADLVRGQLTAAVGSQGLTWRLARTDHCDADTQEAACALLTVHIHDQDQARAGRRFARAAIELALASYPGCTLTTLPGDAHPYGSYQTEFVAQKSLAHMAVLPDGRQVAIEAHDFTADHAPAPDSPLSRPTSVSERPSGPSATDTRRVPPGNGAGTQRVPLGTVFGARSGDKGSDAHLGVWARSPIAFEWLQGYLSVDELQRLLPECAPLTVHRYELANLRALSFVIVDLLAPGVAGSTRFDPQAKALGEWLRSRLVDIPEELL